MNWLLVVVVLFLAAYIYGGYRRGFIKTVFAVFAVLIAMVVASVGSPILSKTLQGNEMVYNYINEKVTDTLKIDDKVEGAVNQINVIDKLPLPDSLKDSLKENNNKEIQNQLQTSTFGTYVSGYVTCLILNSVSYMILFIITLIIVRIIANVLDLVSKLPILNSINKVGGLLIGLVHGLVILWVLCIVLTMFSGSEVGGMLFELVNESQVLSFIYNNNLLMNVVLGVAKTLLVIG